MGSRPSVCEIREYQVEPCVESEDIRFHSRDVNNRELLGCSSCFSERNLNSFDSTPQRNVSNFENYSSPVRVGWHPEKKRDESCNIVNSVMHFGRRATMDDELRSGFSGDLERMIDQTHRAASDGRPYHSAQMYSSITKVSDDGLLVSESRGLTTSANGGYKMAHQRRIGERSHTRMRLKKNAHVNFEESQSLRRMTYSELPSFNAEFKHRTKDWRSYQGVQAVDQYPVVLEDGRQPISYVPACPSAGYQYQPRGIYY